MIGYEDYTDASLQPEEDPSEEAFLLVEEKIIDVLENNGFETVATILAGSDGWCNAINAYLAEQNKHRNEF
ncbi:TPA: hypothetical protein PXF07_002509 [Mannheimia haemolytica]|uniref:Uncharacterized protein n=2 Tax=Mannheimia haemolytica TaxID=75985 RepID=A0A378MRX7_MANHA|nr:hypothetical protein [Mannheimia haemolytica]YP_009193597.1 hypothetical protein AU484_gp46 [Mannheimia phage vB_MhS_587AP2]AGQ37934.1 hypothetical protein J450_01860 [Mannheimia haemolytica D171]AJA73021.1 hypothetical protein 587AP2_46 [Mannheimia phage vB_MhS_587AP2]KYL13345.1 hypothetical protein AC571_12635 [Mannheimia haemolytica]KYL20154.1 hypothetical protein AC574_12395 [Mannheimia haemolytica]MDW0366945.1 hypothetical protein [Mannheimia haemolytica]